MDIPLPSDPPIGDGGSGDSTPSPEVPPSHSPSLPNVDSPRLSLAANDEESASIEVECGKPSSPQSPVRSSSPVSRSPSPTISPLPPPEPSSPQFSSSPSPSHSTLEEIDAPLPPLPPLPSESLSAATSTILDAVNTSSGNDRTKTDSELFTFDTTTIGLESIELPTSAPAGSSLPPPPLPSAVLLGDFSMTSHFDIPMPDDPNRYSPSLPIDDDPPPLPPETNSSSHSKPVERFDIPAAPPLPAGPPPPAVPRSIVLGRQQAKKRLLAFSMTKQGGGAGLSFSLPKKSPVLNKDASKMFASGGAGGTDTDAAKKKQKKAKEIKARGTIEEIEELKRKEVEMRVAMMRETVNIPRLGQIRMASESSTTVLPTSAGIPAGVNLAEQQTSENPNAETEMTVDDAKRQRKKKHEEEERERRLKRKEEREKRKKRMKTLPKNWEEFNKDKHRVYHFRRFKYEIEKQSLRDPKDDKRRRRSRDRRSRLINLFL